MTDKSKHDPAHITRRHLLRSATLIGATTAIPLGVVSSADANGAEQTATSAASAAPREAFETLTATESDLLEVIVERLIPSDEHGPGAKEARVAHYIDRALGSALSSSRTAYASGLEALNRYAESSRGKPFLKLSPTDQDSVLIDCETGGATGFSGSSAQFFAMLLSHTKQGMFGDPYYGGTAGFVGWDLLGYPGVRTAVTADDQKALEAKKLKPVRRSAYDYGSFNKASRSDDVGSHDETAAGVMHHGD
jgi:gluconate 2-dehydrogenase gamma chain